MTSDAAESATERDDGAHAVDGMARIRGADDRPLVYELSTAEVVQEALAALRRDRVEPLDDALVPGMHFPPSRHVHDDPSNSDRAGIRTRNSPAVRRRHRQRPVEAAHSGGDQPGAPSPRVGTGERRHRQRYRLLPAWLAAGVCLVAAVGIALLAMTAVNQRDLDGRQPGGQIPVTAEANASGQLTPSSAPPPAVEPNNPATAGLGSAPGDTGSAAAGTSSSEASGSALAGTSSAAAAGSAAGSPAPIAGTPVIPTFVATTVVPPASSGQQPAVISTLGAGDQGFGWPSSAFGTAGG